MAGVIGFFVCCSTLWFEARELGTILRRHKLGLNNQHGSNGTLLISAKGSVLQRVGGGSWSQELGALVGKDPFYNDGTGN